MSFKSAKEALNRYVADNWPSTSPVFYENGPTPNHGEISGPFATFEVDLQDSHQAEIGKDAVNRYYGVAYFTFFELEGEGTSYIAEGFDWVVENMANKRFGPCTCKTPSSVSAPTLNGWYCKTVQLPFFYHY